MDYDLKKLGYLLAVARTGNFSRAAQELHITQPALSRSIAALEDQFGVTIFERGRNGAKLTPVGELAVAEAESLIRRARSLEHNLRLYQTGDGGKITFGMGPLMGSLILPGLSSDFLKSRPALCLRAVVKSAPLLLDELMNDQLELFFCGVAQVSPAADIVIEQVGALPIASIVRADHPLANKRRVNPDALAKFPTLCGVEMPLPTGHSGEFVCDNYHVLKETALRSDGVWISSPLLAREEIARGQLVELPLTSDARPRQTEVFMVTRRDQLMSPSASQIANYVRTFFKDLDAGG